MNDSEKCPKCKGEGVTNRTETKRGVFVCACLACDGTGVIETKPKEKSVQQNG